MADIAELDTAPDTIEAELIYLADTGEKLITQVAEPGGRDQRQGGDHETHRVKIHNGRPLADRFELKREGFCFVDSATKVGNFLDEDEIRRVYYPECEALIKQVSGAKRVVVFDHTLRTASDRQRQSQKIRDIVSRVHNDYTEWSGRSGCATSWARRQKRCCAAALRSSRCGGRSTIRSRAIRWRFATPRPSRPTAWLSTSATIPTGSARPTRSPTIRNSAGTGSRICGRTRPWCSRSTNPCATAAPGGPRTPPSPIRARRRLPGRARASRSARWRFFSRQSAAD